MREKFKRLCTLPFLGSMALAGLPLAACDVAEAPAASDGAAADEIPVRVVRVQPEEVARPVRATGRLGHAAESRLAFKVGGVVARILVDDGARVRRGQLLARLDPREIDAQLRGAESARAKAERDLARAQLLRRDDVVTPEVLENATTAAEIARASADAARFNRRFSEIRAPADGVVLAHLVEAGEVVGPGTPVVVVGETPTSSPGTSTERLAGGAPKGSRRSPTDAARTGNVGGRVVRVGVSDRDVVRLAVGDPAAIRLDALPGCALAGAVDEIAPAATPTTGSFEVTVRVTGPAGLPDVALAAGMIARVDITPRATETVVAVPTTALVDADGTRGRVFVLAADRRRVEPRAVDIAFVAGDRVALAGGLDGAALVVADGAPYLDEHSLVVVKP